MRTISAAIYDLEQAAESAAQVLAEFATPAVTSCLSLEGLGQGDKNASRVRRYGLQHHLLMALAWHIFHCFRCSYLVIDPSLAMSLPGSAGAGAHVEEEEQLLQLQIEQKRARKWLAAVQASSGEAARAAFQQLAREYASSIWSGLQAEPPTTTMAVSLMMHVTNCEVCTSNEVRIILALQAAVEAAMKVQVLTSAMHSQLVRLYVPGWEPLASVYKQPYNLCTSSDHELAWPGVLPYVRDGEGMQRAGVKLTAAAEWSGVGNDTKEVAVFCAAPGLLQVAPRVGMLPEFGGDAPALGSPYKVLVKAKVYTIGGVGTR